MILYPKLYLNSVLDITAECIQKNNLKALILDVDNTLIDFDKKMSKEVIEWCHNLKEQGVKMCIVSNTNKFEKVKRVASKLDLKFFYFAKKPFKVGFKKAQEYLGLESHVIAVVGDQIFTDVIGGNRMKMFTILVEPLDERDFFITKIKRPFEKFVIKRYINKNKGKVNNI